MGADKAVLINDEEVEERDEFSSAIILRAILKTKKWILFWRGMQQ